MAMVLLYAMHLLKVIQVSKFAGNIILYFDYL